MKNLTSILLVVTILILGACCVGLHIKARNLNVLKQFWKFNCENLENEIRGLRKFQLGQSYEEVYATYEDFNKASLILTWKLESGEIFTSQCLVGSSLNVKIPFMEKGMEYRLIIVKDTHENDSLDYWIIDMIEIAD